LAGLKDGWRIAAIVLTLVIIAGVAVIASRCGADEPLEIILTPGPEYSGQVAVSGAVNNPGIYPYKDDDTIGDLIRAAGGPADGADAGSIELIIPADGGDEPQKVNINRAGAWLLEALPGIGEERAQAIVAYREANGPFRDIYELLDVSGIGETTLAAIEDMITVTD
jgi:competence protein ComEA